MSANIVFRLNVYKDKQTDCHQSGDQFFPCIGVERKSASIYHAACLKKCTPAAESSVSHTEAIIDRKRQRDGLGGYCLFKRAQPLVSSKDGRRNN